MNKIQITEIIKMHHPKASGRQFEMFIEMAADRIAQETGITKKTLLISSVAGTRWYDIDSTVIEIDKVYFNDVKIPKLIGDPIIDDDEFVVPEDSRDTALSTPSANLSNKRMWMFSKYDSSSSTSKTYRLGILEKVTNAITKDGRTSDFQSCSITGSGNIRIYATTFGSRFTQATSGTDQDDAMLSTVGPLKDIPIQYHEILATGAIAFGYKFPPSIDMQAYQVFMDDFMNGVSRIKKFERTKTGTGFIRPQSF
jgi:hypothetical protein